MKSRTIAFLALLVLFTAVYSSAAIFLGSPRPAQPFIAWGICSEPGPPPDCFPETGLDVAVGQTFNWRLEISNRMGTVQFVRVVYRIGNLTSLAPSKTGPAEGLPEIGMAEKFIGNLETARIDFVWRVVSVSSGPTVYPVLEINGKNTTSSVGAVSGRDFRLFLELWTLDPATSSFQYGWSDGNSRVGSWLQVGFNITP